MTFRSRIRVYFRDPLYHHLLVAPIRSDRSDSNKHSALNSGPINGSLFLPVVHYQLYPFDSSLVPTSLDSRGTSSILSCLPPTTPTRRLVLLSSFLYIDSWDHLGPFHLRRNLTLLSTLPNDLSLFLLLSPGPCTTWPWELYVKHLTS